MPALFTPMGSAGMLSSELPYQAEQKTQGSSCLLALPFAVCSNSRNAKNVRVKLSAAFAFRCLFEFKKCKKRKGQATCCLCLSLSVRIQDVQKTQRSSCLQSEQKTQGSSCLLALPVAVCSNSGCKKRKGRAACCLCLALSVRIQEMQKNVRV